MLFNKSIKKYRIDSVELLTIFVNGYEEGFLLGWEGNMGFGQIKIIKNKENGKIYLNTEYMSKEFVIVVLTKLVEDAILDI